MLGRVDAGEATYEDANAFAESVAEKMAEAFRQTLSPEKLPNGTLYFNIAERTVRKMLQQGAGMTRGFCERVQEGLNRRAGLHLATVPAESEEDRIKDLIDKLTYGEYDKHKESLLFGATQNLMRHVVDSSVDQNADRQSRAGLHPIIRRITDGNCCAWCTSLAGTYEAAEAPKDIYRRHQRCGCVVTYDPGDGKRVNVHTKRLRDEEEREERIAKAKELEQARKIEADIAKDFRVLNAQDRKLDLSPETIADPKHTEFILHRVKDISQDVLVSEDAKVTSKGLSKALKAMRSAARDYGQDPNALPRLIIVSLNELGGDVVGRYNWVTNTFYLSAESVSLSREALAQLQQSVAFGDDPRSTTYHEMWHWAQAQQYRKGHGLITDETSEDYVKWLRERTERRMKKQGVTREIAECISKYAGDSYEEGVFFEVEAEYKTFLALGGRL